MSSVAASNAGVSVKYINPFVESVYELFSKMFNETVTRGAIALSDGKLAPRSITAIIGLSGPIRGTVAINMPTNTAIAMVNRLLDTENRVMDDTVSDGVMEVVNMIAGVAKARFPHADNNPIRLSLPTVVRGSDFQIEHPRKSRWIEVPFSSGLGNFTVRVTFDAQGGM